MISESHPAYPERRGPHLGYWRTMDRRCTTDRRAHPAEHIDPSWDPAERVLVLEYLRAGATAHEWLGSSTCRLCGLRPNGSRCLTDGVWTWPEGLAHYVEHHGLRVPQSFVDHVRARL